VLASFLLAGVAAARADVASDAFVHADATRAFGYGGKGVAVAILDTGIDGRSADFAGAVVAEHCIVPPDGCPNVDEHDLVRLGPRRPHGNASSRGDALVSPAPDRRRSRHGPDVKRF
jgi:subtilisin family serine protease